MERSKDKSSSQAEEGSFFMPESVKADRAALRVKTAVLAVVLVILFVLSWCISATTYEVYSPADALHAVATWFSVTFATIFQGQNFTVPDITAMAGNYYQVLDRTGISFIAVICGVILTTSGMIYQNVFRNPVAAPTMLGVGSGVSIGLLIFIIIYGTNAVYAHTEHYLFAYGGGIVVLLLVLGLSRFLNGKRFFSVVDMLLVGSIVSMLFSQIVFYVTYYVFDDSAFVLYANISEVLQVNTAPIAYVFLVVAFLITFVPVYALRFRLNALSFTETEARGMGVSLNRFRYIMLALATIMIVAAMAHSGMVGMAALVVPFISRAFFGAEARKQLVGNILIGGILVLACRDIADLLSIVLWQAGFLFAFPISVVASFVCLPFFVYIVAKQQRTWE